MFRAFALSLSILLLSSPSAQADQINMRFQSQQQSNWCWAATSVSVINYIYKRGGALGADTNGNYVYQCRMATQYNAPGYGRDYCCNSTNGRSSRCDKPGNLRDPLTAARIYNRTVDGALNNAMFATIVSEVATYKRPVIGAIRWSGRNVGHAIIAYGVGFGGVNGGQSVYINDPRTGNQVSLAGRNGLNNYGSNQNGSWKASTFVTNY